ncbi:hypothetical protein Mapa_016236 [Marchantia paleacea]|nr:hypothetical protein Mapa_016236 [Marchantia paleacea]
MKIALVLGVLAILVCEHRALAQTSTLIEAGMDEKFTVECYAFENGTTVQKNYGLWEMQLHQLQSLQLAAVDTNTSDIDCHFVWQVGNSTMHQYIAVYLKSGLVFPCGDLCRWTVFADGFYLFNPANDSDTLQHQWLTGEDSWMRPVS